METIKILSTKELHPSLTASAENNGISIEQRAFISIHPIETEQKRKEIHKWIMSDKKFFVFTSVNAVHSVKAANLEMPMHISGRIIFTIAGKTSQEAAKLFPQDRIVVADNAAALAATVLLYKVKEVIFFCGDKRRDELPDLLERQQVIVHEVIVYETQEEPGQVQDHYDAVLFFSPSGVSSFFSANELKPAVTCFAIGNTTADTIRDFTVNGIIVADQPTQASIIDAVKKHFNKSIARNE
jgi:uroporphyrinogen-III synthase